MNGHNSLTVSLPLADAEFVRSYAQRHKMSVDEVIDHLIRNLKRITSRPVDAELQSLIGIMPSETDIDALRMQYLTEKYLGSDDYH